MERYFGVSTNSQSYCVQYDQLNLDGNILKQVSSDILILVSLIISVIIHNYVLS